MCAIDCRKHCIAIVVRYLGLTLQPLRDLNDRGESVSDSFDWIG